MTRSEREINVLKQNKDITIDDYNYVDYNKSKRGRFQNNDV